MMRLHLVFHKVDCCFFVKYKLQFVPLALVLYIRKYIALLLLCTFTWVKLQPVMPYIKLLPQIASNLLYNLKAFKDNKAGVNVLGDNVADNCANDAKDDDTKDADKDATKMAKEKEEFKSILHQQQHALLLLLFGGNKFYHNPINDNTRNHINKVFRPPLA